MLIVKAAPKQYSKSDLAKFLGRSKHYISYLVKQGVLVPDTKNLMGVAKFSEEQVKLILAENNISYTEVEN